MNDPALMAKLDAAIPVGRMAQPEEIANVVVFLAGDGASYLTATTIFADGGLMQSSIRLSRQWPSDTTSSSSAAAGGARLAHRLAVTGKKILILERGDWLPREA